MTHAADPALRSRVVILAPVGRDAALTRALLERAGLTSVACADLDHMQKAWPRAPARLWLPKRC